MTPLFALGLCELRFSSMALSLCSLMELESSLETNLAMGLEHQFMDFAAEDL